MINIKNKMFTFKPREFDLPLVGIKDFRALSKLSMILIFVQKWPLLLLFSHFSEDHPVPEEDQF